jgi:homocysteine S-methyltransferase
VILDGGLGVELEQRGFVPTTSLWSGEAILARPDLLVEVHRAYLEAGAEVISTATYQVSHAALRGLGCDDSAIDAIFARAVRLAREAIAAHRAATGAPNEFLVAGSLGPFGATLGEGGEYSGAQHLEPDALYAFHVERARSMARAMPDLCMFETIPSRAEALVIAHAARDAGLRNVWMSFTCADDTHTCAHDRLADVAAELDAFACVDVIGVNCTAPDAIAPLVRAMRAVTDKPIFVCPNLGRQGEGAAHALSGDAGEAAIITGVPAWLALGVTHIGGCCGVGPETIRALARVVGETGARSDHRSRKRNSPNSGQVLRVKKAP